MSALDWAATVSLVAGGFFFLAGTAGLLRFPDVFTRLHAVAKVDNLGLGFTILGLMLQAESALIVGKLLLIWLVALLASATSGYLIASSALAAGLEPWSERNGETDGA